ncbi:hypothetical protein amrb99_72650 [Actinomadura sp. RB99]|nr:hypothetical protein [Actinomadura sp. RB99]
MNRTRRAAMSGTVAGMLALSALTPAVAADRTGMAPSPGTAGGKAGPLPPKLLRNFHGRGKYIVRDLGVTVPFTWTGRDGDSQMIAGGPRYPIWFTNLIYRNSLYTLTYKWPGLNDHECSRIPGFNLDTLNQKLGTSRFVGRETLQRNPRRHVNHWRVGVVVPQLPPGKFLRFPLALGDVYVDQRDRGTFWQVLQFGVQNLFDPELDEWLVMNTFKHTPGKVRLPRQCPR